MILGLRNMASYVKTKATLAHRTLLTLDAGQTSPDDTTPPPSLRKTSSLSHPAAWTHWAEEHNSPVLMKYTIQRQQTLPSLSCLHEKASSQRVTTDVTSAKIYYSMKKAETTCSVGCDPGLSKLCKKFTSISRWLYEDRVISIVPFKTSPSRQLIGGCSRNTWKEPTTSSFTS